MSKSSAKKLESILTTYESLIGQILRMPKKPSTKAMRMKSCSVADLGAENETWRREFDGRRTTRVLCIDKMQLIDMFWPEALYALNGVD